MIQITIHIPVAIKTYAFDHHMNMKDFLIIILASYKLDEMSKHRNTSMLRLHRGCVQPPKYINKTSMSLLKGVTIF